MLYYLFDWLEQNYSFPGASVFEYISFRAALATVISLLIAMIFGKSFINMLQKKQVGETIRDLGLEGQAEKKGTPTMGGLIILAAIIIPTLLCAKLDNVYIVLILVTTCWMGFFGFLDDYIKVFKKNKKGLSGVIKVLGQVSIGLLVGTTMVLNDSVVIREGTNTPSGISSKTKSETVLLNDVKSTKTTIPFLKGNEFDYANLLSFIGEGKYKWAFLVFVPIVIFIVTAVSNGINITDGIDGLASGTSAIACAALGVLAYLSGNALYSNYLNIMFIPGAGELAIFCSAFVGACVGFLWYNAYPAQVFMGDTGSLALGAAIAVVAVMIRKELLIPLLCGIFLAENASVILQVSYFKYTKRKYGEGRRIFKMSPLHHHYQKLGFHESKIVTRFWIIGLMLALLTIVTLKLR